MALPFSGSDRSDVIPLRLTQWKTSRISKKVPRHICTCASAHKKLKPYGKGPLRYFHVHPCTSRRLTSHIQWCHDAVSKMSQSYLPLPPLQVPSVEGCRWPTEPGAGHWLWGSFDSKATVQTRAQGWPFATEPLCSASQTQNSIKHFHFIYTLSHLLMSESRQIYFAKCWTIKFLLCQVLRTLSWSLQCS